MNFDKYLTRVHYANLLQQQRYTFAATMPHNPHEYTLKKDWRSKDEFSEAVKFIRHKPVIETFKGKEYSVFYANGNKYWTMGAPIEETILINRAQRPYPTEYDNCTEDYDDTYAAPEFLEEDQKLMALLGDACQCERVLDIGCGTGLFLKYKDPVSYVGVDPSRKMLDVLLQKFKGRWGVTTIPCPFEDFYPYEPNAFDTVAALYGSSSYVTPEALKRIKDLVAYTGKYFLMFYKDGYTPYNYNRIMDAVKHYGVNGMGFHKGQNIEFGNYIIATGGHDDLL